MKKRDRYKIARDLENAKESFTLNKRIIVFSIILESIFSVLFFYFVYNKGNIVDYVFSLTVLTFFVAIIIFNCFYISGNFKKVKTLNRKYMIATETPEQKMVRERNEKFTRILKKTEDSHVDI